MQEGGVEMDVEPIPPPTKVPRNPSWSHDETVLLLELYLRVGRAGPEQPAVERVSNTLPAPEAALLVDLRAVAGSCADTAA